MIFRLMTSRFPEDMRKSPERPAIGFVIDDKAQIFAFTEKALEVTGRTRRELLGTNIMDLLDEPARQGLKDELSKTWIDVSHMTSLRLVGKRSDRQDFHGKLMHINSASGRMLLLLLRKPVGEG